MSQFLMVFQLIAIMVLGYALTKKRSLDLKTISTVGLYLFIPALLFKGMYTATITGNQVLKIFVLFFIQFVILGVISFFTARLIRLSPASQYSFTLSSVVPNAGMMGIPIVLFAFGASAEGIAALIYSSSAFFLNTIGLFLAAGGVLDWKRSLAHTAKMPPLLAVALALILNFTLVKIPEFVMSPIILMAGGAVPLMLVLLGGQVSNIHKLTNKSAIILASIIRLVLAPIVAFILVKYAIPLPDTLGNIFIIQVSMPTGINTVALTTEFGSDSELVASITSITALFSIVTIPVLLLLFS